MLNASMLLRASLLASCVLLSACQAIVSSVSNRLSENLSSAILNNEDLDVVQEGIPAYLILIDALLEGNDSNKNLLLAAAQLNGSYATAFVQDIDTQQSLAAKARDYALRAACLHNKSLCNVVDMSYDESTEVISSLSEPDVDVMYGLISAWAGWLDVNSSDWSAVAQLPKVKFLVQQLLEIDESYDLGAPHMYMGVFESLLPPAMGGQPELAKKHFERAIELSAGRNLYAKVLYAENYARSTYDRELHDSLLAEVLVADPHLDGYTLQNKVAQRLAQSLVRSADDYF